MEVFTVLAIVVVLGLFANKYMKGRDQAHINERAGVNADLYDRAKEELEKESNMNKDTNEEVKNRYKRFVLGNVDKDWMPV